MERVELELVRFDPEDPDTFPSVCQFPDEVERRFGFTGGELLVFNQHGDYVGELTNSGDWHIEDRIKLRRPRVEDHERRDIEEAGRGVPARLPDPEDERLATPAEQQEAREAAEHFEQAVEKAKEQGAESEEVVVEEPLAGYEVTLKFKIPRLIPGDPEVSEDQARNIADEIMGEAVQIDDSWDHCVDVQEWRR